MQTNPPDNGGYMIAAYLIVAVVILGYAVILVRRSRAALKR